MYEEIKEGGYIPKTIIVERKWVVPKTTIIAKTSLIKMRREFMDKDISISSSSMIMTNSGYKRRKKAQKENALRHKLLIATILMGSLIAFLVFASMNENNTTYRIEAEPASITLDIGESVTFKMDNIIGEAKYSKISWKTINMEISTYGLENSFIDKSVIFKVGSGFEAKFVVDKVLISNFSLRIEHAVGGVRSYCPVKLYVNGKFVDNILSSCVGFCTEDYDLTQYIRPGNNIIKIIRVQQSQHDYLLRSVAIIKK